MRRSNRVLVTVACLLGLLGLAVPAYAEDPGVYDVTVDAYNKPGSGTMTATWRAVVPVGGTVTSSWCAIGWGGVDRWSGACESGQPFAYDVGSVGMVTDPVLRVVVTYVPRGDWLPYEVAGSTAAGAFSLDGVAPTASVVHFLNPLPDNSVAPAVMRPNAAYRAVLLLHDKVSVVAATCRIDRVSPQPAQGVGSASCDTGFSRGYFTTPATSGSYRFVVRAHDRAGNVGAESYGAFEVDADGPQLTFDSGPQDGSATNALAPSWLWHADEAATYRCSVQPAGMAASLATCSSPYTSANLAEGEYDLAVEATDGLGNVSTRTVRFVVDRTRPNLTVTSGPADGATVTSASVSYAFYSTSSVTYQCWFGSPTQTPAYGDCVSGQTFTLPGDGTYVFAFRARDAAGNLSDEVVRTLHVALPVPDTTAPTVRVVKKPRPTVRLPKSRSTLTCTVKIATSEPSTIYYRVGKGRWKVGTKTLRVTVGRGKQTVSAYAVDAAGNRSATVKATWRVLPAR